jgi:hypothetical protein
MGNNVLRIYADYNGLYRDELGRYVVPLDTMGSLRELSNAGIILSNGLELSIYDNSDDKEDLLGYGRAMYQPERTRWLVVLDERGVLYVPRGDRTNDERFLCVRCRTDLAQLIQKRGLALGDTCPTCASALHTAIAPPPYREDNRGRIE